MDPDKVDALMCWKTPMNQDLLHGFLGAARFLADDIDRVRIPMGVLSCINRGHCPISLGIHSLVCVRGYQEPCYVV